MRYFKCSACGEIVNSRLDLDLGGSCHDVIPSAACSGMTSLYEVFQVKPEAQRPPVPAELRAAFMEGAERIVSPLAPVMREYLESEAAQRYPDDPQAPADEVIK